MSHRTQSADSANLIFVTRRLHPSYFLAEQPPLRPGVALALGGGFARGFAHLGVLRVLEENNIPFSCLSGTSIGSIIAAAYASGTPLDHIVAKCREIRFRDFAPAGGFRGLGWRATNALARWFSASSIARNLRIC